MKKFRVLWSGVNVAGHYQFLHDEFCRLGYESHLSIEANVFKYQGGEIFKSLFNIIFA